jgi:anti-sigma factor RsiW
MNCKKVLSRLQAYVDAEMPVKQRSKTEEHLNSCAICRSQFEQIRAIGDILDTLNVPPLPEGFSVRIMAEAKRRTPLVKRKKSFFILEWQPPLQWILGLSASMRLAACAMIFLACLLGMLMSKEVFLSGYPQASVAEAKNLDGFEWFSPTPPASLGSIYMTLAEATPDDSGGK